MAIPLAAPDLHLPPSDATVSVRIIDTTTQISNIALDLSLGPHIHGFDVLAAPSYSFLIEHPSSRKILFDLGTRKDYENLAPAVVEPIRMFKWGVDVKKEVPEILQENGVRPDDIEGIIWSHFHWDHTGNPSKFGKDTALIVGPGFKKAFMPGYPANPHSTILETDYQGRELVEISFSQGIKIGRWDAFDYFDDGSFYILDGPGHTTGHICALARVTASPPSYIFMGGDACHHGGVLRPSKYLPLPASILPNPLDLKSIHPCPGAIFSDILKGGDTKPFYSLVKGTPGSSSGYDSELAELTIEKLQEADARPDVLVVVAHDADLLNVVDIFPKYANDFMEKGWVQKGKWLFLKDFAKAVSK